jgi:Flp pilus assembly protein CpaB
MLRRSPRAVLLWAAGALVGLVTALSIANMLVSIHRQDTRYGSLHTTVVARRDLTVGSTITSGDISERRVRGESAAPGAITEKDHAVGMVVVVPLLRGTEITARHVTTKDRAGDDGVVPDGERAMRVVIEAGTRPRVGDHVDLYASFDPQVIGDGDPTVTVASGAPVLGVDDDTAAGDHGPAIGVTVLVTEAAAKRLAFAQSAGQLALSIGPPESARVPSDP